MKSSNSDYKRELNYLATICNDGEKGYTKAAENAKEEDLINLFKKFASERAGFGAEINTLLKSLGESPETYGGIGGSIHRTWIDIMSGLSGHDRNEILSLCETGEKTAVTSYKNFLEETNAIKEDERHGDNWDNEKIRNHQEELASNNHQHQSHLEGLTQANLSGNSVFPTDIPRSGEYSSSINTNETIEQTLNREPDLFVSSDSRAHIMKVVKSQYEKIMNDLQTIQSLQHSSSK